MEDDFYTALGFCVIVVLVGIGAFISVVIGIALILGVLVGIVLLMTTIANGIDAKYKSIAQRHAQAAAQKLAAKNAMGKDAGELV